VPRFIPRLLEGTNAMWGALILSLFTVVDYTLPRCKSLSPSCDTIYVRCLEISAPCDTVRGCIPETRLHKVRLHWQPRWSAASRVLREKPVTGREGQRDTLRLPADTLATMWLSVVDQAGNESCLSNPVTVNARVAVENPPPALAVRAPVWYDVAGRAHRTRPRQKGLYWEVRQVAGRRVVKKVVVTR
jgi:hypothetical protein